VHEVCLSVLSLLAEAGKPERRVEKSGGGYGHGGGKEERRRRYLQLVLYLSRLCQTYQLCCRPYQRALSLILGSLRFHFYFQICEVDRQGLAI
jgi:hypothetical protein